MLKSQDGGGYQHHALLALADALEGGAQGHLGLAEAHVPAQQPVHGNGPFHVRLDLLCTAELVLCLLVFKVALKIVLPFPVRFKGIALLLHALGVQGDEFPGDVLDCRTHPCFGFLPLLAA